MMIVITITEWAMEIARIRIMAILILRKRKKSTKIGKNTVGKVRKKHICELSPSMDCDIIT